MLRLLLVSESSAQSRLGGQEYPLGKAEEMVGNEKAPMLGSAAKWDINQMLPFQTGKLKGLLCWPDVLSSRRGKQGWGYPTGTWLEVIKNEGYRRWVELDSSSQRQAESSGVGPRSEMGQEALNLGRLCLYIRMKIGIFPFFFCPHWWECHSGDCSEDLPLPCYFTTTLVALVLQPAFQGKRGWRRDCSLLQHWELGIKQNLRLLLPVFGGFRLSCASLKAKIQKVQIQCWQQQAVPTLEEDGAVEICRQRILEERLQWNRQLQTFSYIVRGETDCWGTGESRMLSLSQDRLHNISCSHESPGMSCAARRALRAGQNSVLTWKGFVLLVNPKRHFFLAFLLKFDYLKRFRNCIV